MSLVGLTSALGTLDRAYGYVRRQWSNWFDGESNATTTENRRMDGAIGATFTQYKGELMDLKRRVAGLKLLKYKFQPSMEEITALYESFGEEADLEEKRMDFEIFDEVRREKARQHRTGVRSDYGSIRLRRPIPTSVNRWTTTAPPGLGEQLLGRRVGLSVRRGPYAPYRSEKRKMRMGRPRPTRTARTEERIKRSVKTDTKQCAMGQCKYEHYKKILKDCGLPNVTVSNHTMFYISDLIQVCEKEQRDSQGRHKRQIGPLDIVLSSLLLSKKKGHLKDGEERIFHMLLNAVDELRIASQGRAHVLNSTVIDLEHNRETINNLLMLTEEFRSKVEIEVASFDSQAQMLTYLQILESHGQLLIDYIRVIEHQVDWTELKLQAVMHNKASTLLLPPVILEEVLKNITGMLPTDKYLPYDMKEELFVYYKILSVIGLSHKQGVYCVMALPLVNQKLTYELYEVVNLPVYYPDTNLTAQYHLEQKVFAVTKDRNYVLFPDEQEFNQCIQPYNKFCAVDKPLIQANHIDANCVIKMFLSQNTEENKCPIEFKVDTSPMQGKYLHQGKWLVSVRESTVVKQFCDGLYKQTLLIKPSIHILDLPTHCYYEADYFKLLPHTIGRVALTVEEPPIEIEGNLSIWTPVSKQIQFAQAKFPHKLGALVSKSSSILELKHSIQGHLNQAAKDTTEARHELNWLSQKHHSKWYVWTIIALVIMLVLGIIILVIYCKYCRKGTRQQNLRLMEQLGMAGLMKSEPIVVAPAPTNPTVMEMTDFDTKTRKKLSRQIHAKKAEQLMAKALQTEQNTSF